MSAVRGMLARPDYLIPLAAAERQFRDHYYGLNSAALLEDLFFDALGSYVRQVQPDAELSRPPTGQKGWDYAFDGLQISHKVSQNLAEIAALWDATKKGIDRWSFDDPIVYVLGANTPSTSLRIDLADGTSVGGRSVADLGRPYRADGKTLMIVSWPAEGSQPLLLDVIPTEKGQTVGEALPFGRVWAHVAAHVAAGRAANEIDVIATTRALRPMDITQLHADELPLAVDLSVRFRGGAYLFPRELLQNLAVTSNNRAILIPKPTIHGLLDAAVDRRLFAPLPLWYWVYAQERPPDMFAAQRAEYDARFAARGRADLG